MHQRWVWHTTTLSSASHIVFYEDLQVSIEGYALRYANCRRRNRYSFLSDPVLDVLFVSCTFSTMTIGGSIFTLAARRVSAIFELILTHCLEAQKPLEIMHGMKMHMSCVPIDSMVAVQARTRSIVRP